MPSDQDIIAQQEVSLNDPKKVAGTAAESSVTAEQSGVTDAGLEGFPTTAGIPQVSTGRTGMTGGGTNPQILSEAEGAGQSQGESSAFYENAQGRGDVREQLEARQPGSINAANDGVQDATTRRTEALGTTTRPGEAREPELIDQSANKFDA